MEQHADLQRTVKTMGSNGLESFTTVHLETLHFESHMMSTNCGPLGIKSDVEPGTNRAALSDRSVAHVVHAADDAGQNKSDGEFNLESASDTVREQVNRLRVVSCLMAYGLVFIKHLPHCQPNITYARELTNKWDDIQNDEFNLPRPSRRKKLKRKMMFHVFAMESAVVEKFLWKHTAIDFKDMLPDANGNLSGFCMDQMVDVIRSLQRCLDHETILNAWSHNLDHSPPTTSHVFQMKTVLSQLHGARHTITFKLYSNHIKTTITTLTRCRLGLSHAIGQASQAGRGCAQPCGRTRADSGDCGWRTPGRCPCRARP